nr:MULTISPECIES: hypothetical protein [unclassified Streptomyces]
MQPVHLDGVAHLGPGAVQFDVRHGVRGHPRDGEGLGDDPALPLGAGRGEAGARGTVVVDGGAPDHGVHRVAVGERVGEPLEDDHTAAAAEDRAARLGVERPAVPVGGVDATGHMTVAAPVRRLDLHAARERDVAVAEPERLAGQMGGDQGGGAGGAHIQAGAVEAEPVGRVRGQVVDVVGDQGDHVADLGEEFGVGADVVVHVGVAGAAAVDADLPVVAGGFVAGVLERGRAQFEEEPVLRVAQFALARGDAEVGVVEAAHVVQQGPGGYVVRILDQGRVLARGQQLFFAEPVDAVASREEVAPELVGVARVGGPHGQSDDRDGVSAHCSGAFLAGEGGRGVSACSGALGAERSGPRGGRRARRPPSAASLRGVVPGRVG